MTKTQGAEFITIEGGKLIGYFGSDDEILVVIETEFQLQAAIYENTIFSSSIDNADEYTSDANVLSLVYMINHMYNYDIQSIDELFEADERA